jgi:pantetheine-phosphate adenylyltransferase
VTRLGIAIYPGTFDPVTHGHLDIVKRAAHMFDKVIVAVAKENYKNPLFSVEERVDLMKTVVANMKNVEVESFNGLLVDYCNEKEATTIIRGLRALSDFEYEFQMALMNRKLNSNVDTVFLMTCQRYSFISSSIIKQVATLGGSVSEFVPEQVVDALARTFNRTDLK